MLSIISHQCNAANPRILSGQFLHDLPTVIRATIIDKDDLEWIGERGQYSSEFSRQF